VELRNNRVLTLAAGVFFVFVAVALAFTQVIPGPHTAVDYLVIGTAATFAALLTLFVLLMKTWAGGPEVFYKLPKKEPKDKETDQETIRSSTSA